MEDNELKNNNENENIDTNPEDIKEEGVNEETREVEETSETEAPETDEEPTTDEDLEEEDEEEDIPKPTKEEIEALFEKENKSKKKIILLAGTILILSVVFFSVYYFFFYRLNLQTNISTDKKIEFKQINGKKEQITTQMFISDLAYTMRYDIANFRVFSYRDQDIYKGLVNEDVLVAVEKSTIPTVCGDNGNNLDLAYNQCEVLVDQNTTEYYIYDKNDIYKITVKLPYIANDEINYTERIEIMLNTFKMER